MVTACVSRGVADPARLILRTAALGFESRTNVIDLRGEARGALRSVLAKAVRRLGRDDLLTVPAALITVLIALEGFDQESLWWGATIATIAGSIVYSTLFVGLSTITGRALIIGLVYVFVWEAFITNLFEGTRWISVREYVIGIADAATTAEAVSARLEGSEALIASLVVVALSLAAGVHFLRRFEIGEQS